MSRPSKTKESDVARERRMDEESDRYSAVVAQRTRTGVNGTARWEARATAGPARR
jgi:hypothetical protein